MDRRETIAQVLYGELSDGPDGDVHPFDERWYRAADQVLEAITHPKENDAFDALEDILVRGFHFDSNDRVPMKDVGALLDAARAVLMIHRGVEPIMPDIAPA